MPIAEDSPGSEGHGERTVATAAGVYDWLLHGHHHLPCDADAAIEAQRAFPRAAATARHNRQFLERAVLYMLRPDNPADTGVHQFLDIGSGYPTAGAVHEITHHRTDSSQSTVVYVDHDEDTVKVSQAILARHAPYPATCVHGDIRDPDAIFDHPRVRSYLDFSKPLGLLMVAVLPFVDDAAPLVQQSVDRLAPGSFLAITHPTMPGDQRTQTLQSNLQRRYNAMVQQSGKYRTRDEIAALFAGTDLVPPGLTQAAAWRPARPRARSQDEDEASAVLLGGVGRVP
jgi:SAM-dependent methyltransferase